MAKQLISLENINPYTESVSAGVEAGRRKGQAFPMLDPCCSTMRAMTLTREDIRRDPEFAEAGVGLGDWTPLVYWSETTGTMVMGHTAIFHCPWCGARLPDLGEAALAEARRHRGFFAVDPAAGGAEAWAAGRPADADALLAELLAATEAQDFD